MFLSAVLISVSVLLFSGCDSPAQKTNNTTSGQDEKVIPHQAPAEFWNYLSGKWRSDDISTIVTFNKSAETIRIEIGSGASRSDRTRNVKLFQSGSTEIVTYFAAGAKTGLSFTVQRNTPNNNNMLIKNLIGNEIPPKLINVQKAKSKDNLIYTLVRVN